MRRRVIFLNVEAMIRLSEGSFADYTSASFGTPRGLLPRRRPVGTIVAVRRGEDPDDRSRHNDRGPRGDRLAALAAADTHGRGFGLRWALPLGPLHEPDRPRPGRAGAVVLIDLACG